MTLKSLEASIRVYGKLKEVWNYPKKGGVTHRMADETQINILNIQCKRRTKKCFVVQYRF